MLPYKNATLCAVRKNAQSLFAKDDWAEWFLKGSF